MYIIISIFIFKNNYKEIILVEKISFISYLISFIFCCLINPGIPKRDYYYKTFEKEYKGKFKLIKCDKCSILFPKNIKINHCIYCNICIRNYDHHCVWVGKCVGKYTKIPFYLFVISILCYILCSIVLFITFIKINFWLNIFIKVEKWMRKKNIFD